MKKAQTAFFTDFFYIVAQFFGNCKKFSVIGIIYGNAQAFYARFFNAVKRNALVFKSID